MLSIDITDKQLKLVRGSLAGSKIRVNDVETRDVPEGSIVNGYITNIPLVAGEITDMLEAKRISDKEITVCINSSSILYKELEIPKPKTLKNSAAIEGMIIAQMGIASDYNISYSIVGESVDGDRRAMLKVMATACPQRMVDGYQGLFSQLGMKLKQINISNNCITRLILNTPKLKEVMPFLCIQVDVDFININLYENGQVALSRYVKIDPADYDNNPDYINIAVFDNLFRMIQFIGQRSDSRPLKQIMFYGIIKDFVTLSNAIQSFNIPAHVLAMPNNIVKFCEVDFSRYANAIGAFYKVNPDYEHINLLKSKAVTSKRSANMFPLKVLLVAAVAVGVVFGVRVWIDDQNKSLTEEIEAVQKKIEDPDFEIRRQRMEAKRTVLANFSDYKYSVMTAKDLFDYMPKTVLPQIDEKLFEAIRKIDGENKRTLPIYDFEFSGYSLKYTLYCLDNAYPSDLAEALEQGGFFEGIDYKGYETVLYKEADESILVRLYDWESNNNRFPWEKYGISNEDEINEENRVRERVTNSPRYGWRELTWEEDGGFIKFEITIRVKGGHVYENGKLYEYKPDGPIVREQPGWLKH
ncbi:MAG: competence protein ComA [Oscillospiraceae bacterium]|jgi:type IV pilus assembly protein PilM|nr:competence protein ComA [Oscillospiraceae bacterium]